MPNVVKRLVSAQYEASFGKAEGLLFVSMAGLTVEESEVLRGALHQSGAGLCLVKNSLAQRVLEAKGFEFGADVLAGNVAIAYGSTEATIAAAKIVSKSELAKAGKLALRAGVLEGNQLKAADAKALANVPDKQTLRAQLAGVLQAPLRGLAATLAGVPGGLARVLQARADQAAAEPSEAAAQ